MDDRKERLERKATLAIGCLMGAINSNQPCRANGYYDIQPTCVTHFSYSGRACVLHLVHAGTPHHSIAYHNHNSNHRNLSSVLSMQTEHNGYSTAAATWTAGSAAAPDRWPQTGRTGRWRRSSVGLAQQHSTGHEATENGYGRQERPGWCGPHTQRRGHQQQQ